MQILIPGHRYRLENHDKSQQPLFQEIQFIHKEPINGVDGELRTVTNGTTNEELIKVLIDRLETMNSKFPCLENANARLHLSFALEQLELRTAARLARGVEGKALP